MTSNSYLAFTGGTPAQKIMEVNSQLNTTLTYYSEWGIAVGTAMFACMMAATLLGILVRSL